MGLIRVGLNTFARVNHQHCFQLHLIKKTWLVEIVSKIPIQMLKQWLLFEQYQHYELVYVCVCVVLHLHLSSEYVIPDV